MTLTNIPLHQAHIPQRCLIVFLLIIGLMFLQLLYSLHWQPTLSPSGSDLTKALALISRIRSNFTSQYGLRYRSLICSVVRNDPHLLEFIVRHLIVGFSHIVIYDNNRILAGHDTNISGLLSPFVTAGVVTHVPWQQNSTESLPNGDKNGNTNECFNQFGRHADWVSTLDTDEYLYYEKDNVAVNSLHDLLVELEQKHYCAVSVYWTMMYGEGRVRRPNGTLFDLYPRRCKTIGQTKVLARLNYTDIDIPHHATCKNNTNLTAIRWSSKTNAKIDLVHYYSKSIEEFLLKGDQSIPPYAREPTLSYSDSGPICDRIRFDYSTDYTNLFRQVHEQLEQLSSFQPVHLHPPPGLNLKHISIPQYALFIYLKYRCAKQQEFDNDNYLLVNPEAKQLIENGTYTDGLHHFMKNFITGVKGCWKSKSHSICE